jgi:hypothetical protein
MTARAEQLGNNTRGRTTSARTAMTVHSRQDTVGAVSIVAAKSIVASSFAAILGT